MRGIRTTRLTLYLVTSVVDAILMPPMLLAVFGMRRNLSEVESRSADMERC